METHLVTTRKHMQTHAERADRLLVEVNWNFMFLFIKKINIILKLIFTR
jgi:hypothetical protein